MLDGASGSRRHGLAVGASVVVLVVVTVAIGLLKSFVPVLSLGVLYVFAVLPIAVAFGLVYAVLVSIASMLAFNWFFLPPVHTFTLSDSRNWFALAVYLVTARRRERSRRERPPAGDRGRAARGRDRASGRRRHVAARGRRRGRPARLDQRARRRHPQGAVGVDRDRRRRTSRPPPRAPIELVAGTRRVGTLELVEGGEPNLQARRRLLPALASLLAVAVDRERLANEAFEAEALRRSRHDEDRGAAGRQPRPALAAHGHPGRERRARGRARSSLTDDDRRELLDTISVEVRRLERVVDNLLALSRLQAGALAPDPRGVDGRGPRLRRAGRGRQETPSA